MAFCGHWGILRTNIVLYILIMARGIDSGSQRPCGCRRRTQKSVAGAEDPL